LLSVGHCSYTTYFHVFIHDIWVQRAQISSFGQLHGIDPPHLNLPHAKVSSHVAPKVLRHGQSSKMIYLMTMVEWNPEAIH
jgi:hypothetical protein